MDTNEHEIVFVGEGGIFRRRQFGRTQVAACQALLCRRLQTLAFHPSAGSTVVLIRVNSWSKKKGNHEWTLMNTK